MTRWPILVAIAACSPPSGRQQHGSFAPGTPPADFGTTIASVLARTTWDAKAFGVKCDGATNDQPAIKTMLAAAAVTGGGVIELPAGTCIVGKDGANTYAINLNVPNVIFHGVRGQTTLKLAIGQPSVVDVINMDAPSNVTIEDLTIDGNWGNAVTTVAFLSDNTTLPQATINVASTTNFPASGSFTLIDSQGVTNTITCTGQTATSFTGCTGGTSVMHYGDIVGYVDGQSGINHTTQVDPQNTGVRVRGGSGVLLRNLTIQNVYGDCVSFLGTNTGGTGDYAKDDQLLDSTCSITARHAVTLGGGRGSRIHIQHLTTSYNFGFSIDSEPFNGYLRNATIDNNNFGTWWHPSAGNIGVSIEGGNVAEGNAYNNSHSIAIENNTLAAPINLLGVKDIDIGGNSIRLDYPGYSLPAIRMIGYGDGVTIHNNHAFVRTQKDSTPTPNACYSISNDAPQATNGAHNIVITGNTCDARNGARGIEVIQSAGSTTTDSGTASAITGLSLTDGTKAWTTNQWQGFTAQVGAAQCSIVSNTATVLTCGAVSSFQSSYGWFTSTGKMTATPAAGAYTIADSPGVVLVEGNTINGGGKDWQGEGYGVGGYGLYTEESSGANGRNGSRVILRGNILEHVGSDAIHVKTNSLGFQYLEITNNRIVEHRSPAVTTNCIAFERSFVSASFVMSGNRCPSTVTNTLSNLSSGSWLVDAGPPQQWAGFGSPSGSVTATPGAVYQNLSGGASTSLYVKESGTGNTGWTAIGGNTAFPPDWVSQLLLVGGDFDLVHATGTQAVTAGALWMMKVRVYATSFSKVLFVPATSNVTGATNVYVAIYNSDGTQSASMATATVDANTSFNTGSLPRMVTVTLTNSVTGLTYGSDIYVAVLVTGTPSPGLTLRSGTNTLSNGNLSPNQGLRSGQSGSGQSSVPASVTISSMTAVGSLAWTAVQ